MNHEEIAIDFRGWRAFQHGIGRYGDNTLTLTLYETVDSKVSNFLEAYMDLQWTPVGGVQVPKSLNQSQFLLTLLDSENKARKHYTIIGAWLQGYQPVELQSEGSTVIVYSTTWQFDYFI